MKSLVLRMAAAGLLVGLAAASNLHGADASLGFCRTDPVVLFFTPDHATHLLTLSADIATTRKQVSEVNWTVNLPANSRLVKVWDGGPIKENVSVSTQDAVGTVDVSSTTVSADTVDVKLSGSDLFDRQVQPVTSTGSTNQPISLQIHL